MNLEKILKYVVWSGLVLICFTPLIVIRDYFFPFIVPKSIYFRVIVEVIFLAWLGLAVLNKQYRPKINLVLVLFFLYLVTVYLSSFINDSLYFSFWSNNERSEGLLLMTHLFAFLIVASSFFKSVKEWLIIFEASFLSSIVLSFIALKQYLDPDWTIFGQVVRLAATIGNAGYMAGYLIFNIFFGLLLFFYRKHKYLKWYYLLGIILQIFIVFNTLTRGGIIALVFGLVLFVGYLVFYYYRKIKIVRNTGLAFLILVVLFSGLLFMSKEAAWVKGNKALNRIVSISMDSPTAKTRLMTWNSAYQGFKEKPILGYGYENFYQVFDKHFDPRIYSKAGAVTWFDRAHNIIFDRLITGGIIGLLLYLSMLFAPLYFIWRYYRRQVDHQKYLLPVIFSLIIISYFIQNLFIFEALVTYIPLFIALAFLSQFCPTWAKNFSQSKKPYLVLLTLYIIVFLPILFTVNLRPAQANKMLVEAIIMSTAEQYQEAYDKFIEVIDSSSFANQEYRQHFAEFVSGIFALDNVDNELKIKDAERAEQELYKHIAEKPNTRNYLMTIRFLNKAYIYDANRLNKALDLFEEAIIISPTRQSLYTEAGYSQYFLGSYFQNQGNEEKTKELYDKSIANMQKAIDLNDQVVDSYANMIMILLVTKNDDKIQVYYDKMNEVNVGHFREEETLKRLGNSSIHSQSLEWAVVFYQALMEIDPNNPSYLINVALAHANLGNDEQAIALAEELKKFGTDYEAEADKFIQNVKDGLLKSE